MAKNFGLIRLLVAFLFALELACAQDQPQQSPALAPEADDFPDSPPPPPPQTGSLSPADSSPPASPPSPDTADPGPAPSIYGMESSPSPCPAPEWSEPSDINHSDMTADAEGEKASGGGKKAGIAIGVILTVGVVVIGGVVYKKRQDNIRRSIYGYAARDIL